MGGLYFRPISHGRLFPIAEGISNVVFEFVCLLLIADVFIEFDVG
jgi:hypothetical protein